ncbi:trypsin-like peptidase domain-containing protein [uncultured Oscillibacter sp.]|uniref:S1C family serine protease n=1 Tax=uncultured Oscillibacter sp. TaxID=876091 RepID=UPI00261719BD|nr:trypsin-like peptidase domain-containing protein [uncultured Oscillibacter sp.]
MDDFKVQNESAIEPPKKKSHTTLLTLLLAAVIAVACGYLGSCLANLQEEEKVVIQKVDVSAAESNVTPAVEVAKTISPTVVSITTEKMTVNNFWFGPQISSGAGSGVIISEDGYILTCAHVISGANSIQVTTSDGVVYTATVVGSYEDGDIAVLKIEAEGLQTAVLGDSDKIQLAETVYAVGNPGGTLSGSITDGIISATSRTISISIENEVGPYGLGINNRIVSLDVLQTNAAVSPGNSGGGLFNANGELIGIVNAKSSGENQEGLGFAIPVNTVQEIAVSLINTGSYTPPNAAIDGKGAVLEIAVVEIAPAAAHMNNREPGVYVQSVKEGSASDGKLEVNDRFVSVNGYMIHTTAELSTQLAEHSPGDSVKLTVDRNGRLEEMEVTLARGE